MYYTQHPSATLQQQQQQVLQAAPAAAGRLVNSSNPPGLSQVLLHSYTSTTNMT
jgi:hypothetical protein